MSAQFLAVVGCGIGAALLIVDRHIHKIPNWLAIPLFILACGCMIAGAALGAARGWH